MPPRRSHHIGRKAGATLLHAPRTANAIGRPLNTFVTIDFWKLGSDAESLFHDFAALRSEWFQRWSSYRDRNGPPTYTYVHEAPNENPHTHWLVHVKPENRQEFELKLARWLARRSGLDALPHGVLHVQDARAEGAKLYMAKGLDPRYATLWRIVAEDGGVIAHRRADTSRNLGPTVWQPLKAAYKAERRRSSRRSALARPSAASPLS